LPLAIAVCCAIVAAARAAPPEAFPAQFRDPTIFTTAIAEAAKDPVTPRVLSGITVPHHLVAADLIARAFRMADASRIDKVIVLFPDHYLRSPLPFATTGRAFETVFGRLDVSQEDIRLLLQSRDLVGDSDLFGSDHGIGAILPFIKHYMPSARIVPIAVSGSRQEDLDNLVARLKQIIGPNTLVVQSTDFSHYLPVLQAVQRDQEVLNILAAGEPGPVARLRQPSHTDSRGSQYLQMRVQQAVFRARPAVVFNANSQAYAPRPVARTTSYVVQLYEPQPMQAVDRDLPGSKVYCFAGDTFFGRGVLRALADPLRAERTLREMQQVLNGCRLVVNLTGVAVPELPINLEHMTLAMPAGLTLEWLKALNVVAVSLANNHTMDLGSGAFDAMAQMLADAGIAVLKHDSIVDLGPFRLAALTDLDNRTRRGEGVIAEGDLARLANSSARPPLFAMVNWGPDYEASPGGRELALMESLRAAAVSLVVGVHPHLAAGGFDLLGGGQTLSVYSLGNFLFDQGATRTSGSVLEVRVFDQGTYFARLVPIPNFLERTTKPETPG
jgi:poly-gamma-glutamate synthesis protein (capsule biosynthesis protein)